VKIVLSGVSYLRGTPAGDRYMSSEHCKLWTHLKQ